MIFDDATRVVYLEPVWSAEDARDAVLGCLGSVDSAATEAACHTISSVHVEPGKCYGFVELSEAASAAMVAERLPWNVGPTGGSSGAVRESLLERVDAYSSVKDAKEQTVSALLFSEWQVRTSQYTARTPAVAPADTTPHPQVGDAAAPAPAAQRTATSLLCFGRIAHAESRVAAATWAMQHVKALSAPQRMRPLPPPASSPDAFAAAVAVDFASAESRAACMVKLHAAVDEAGSFVDEVLHVRSSAGSAGTVGAVYNAVSGVSSVLDHARASDPEKPRLELPPHGALSRVAAVKRRVAADVPVADAVPADADADAGAAAVAAVAEKAELLLIIDLPLNAASGARVAKLEASSRGRPRGTAGGKRAYDGEQGGDWKKSRRGGRQQDRGGSGSGGGGVDAQLLEQLGL